ncbi:hypothetical protein H0R92_13775 [Treponema sp. OMZ 840]|uniref:hypothetical protein n=1 Tax=Treponema sp. OMZ 840 TaxID=244313 RepID=UPI003D912465
MKKWIVPGLCLYCLFTLFFFGCKTPPKDTTPAEQPDSTGQAVVETTDNTGVVQPAGSDLTAANAKLLEQAAAARKKAVDAGAQRNLPKELAAIDKESRDLQSAYKAGGDPAEFNKKMSDIVYRYKALEQASYAYADRKKITDMDFVKYAKKEYDEADKDFRKAESMLKSGASGKDLYDISKKSADGYRSVIKAGYKVLAETERDKVAALKQKADEVKSSVADKNGYTGAVAFYTRANQELQSGQTEKAYNNYVTCYGMLDKVYQGVLKKRAAAEEAMARAKRRVEESDAVAVKADAIAPVEQVEALDALDNTKSGQGAQ